MWDVTFIGKSFSFRNSSLNKLVNGTSAVGMRKSLSDVLNISYSNLGNCPVPISDSSFAMKGT